MVANKRNNTDGEFMVASACRIPSAPIASELAMISGHNDEDRPSASEQRSKMMRSVRRKDTLPEMTVRKAVHSAGLRYRLHVKYLPGSPDIVFPSRKLAVFVHGCFWHRHTNCRHATTPKTRVAFWTDKFRRNRDRDAEVTLALQTLGWDVMVLWECDVKSGGYLDPLLRRLRQTRASQEH
ncbi:very short patch repair endonuclease [Mesorhizobium sp. M3A.F.Ca.ET.175.01.1.1]|uniref:very short patch repair endonuclease n=2 Tax=unclassified Mesorhizobium TaxID=325217 RepID=UPI0032AFE348